MVIRIESFFRLYKGRRSIIKIDKGTIGFNSDNLTIIDFANLSFLGDIHDHVVGLFNHILADGVDDDSTIVIDVDLDFIVAFSNDAVDDLTLGTDDFSDLFWIDVESLHSICEKIKILHDDGMEVAIVIGAGNIWRGKVAEKIGIERVPADYMGMLGTVINAVAMSSALKKIGVPSVVYSAIPEIKEVTIAYDADKVKSDLSQGKRC